MNLNAYEEKHLNTIRPLLSECMVLLKSDGSFPINVLNVPEKVALYGGGARHTIKGGTGSGDVNSRFFVNVEEGLKEAGFTITTNKWLDAYDEILKQAKKDFIKEIKARAKANHTLAVLEGMGAVMPTPEYELELDGEGDLAIYVLSRNSGEGNDRDFVKGDILLNNSEKRDILELNKKYKRFMLVLNVGGPVDLSELEEVKNILVLSQLGVETGAALADVILGKANPSGKLTTSWAYQKDFPTIGEFGDKTETRYNEGIYVGYRYYDTCVINNEYPFGYGLSFTDFSISDSNVEVANGEVRITSKVTNTGNYAGKEVVQVYVSLPDGKIDQPYQVLAGFVKTRELNPGETSEVSLAFKLEEIAGFSEEDNAYILEKGDYIVRVGNSSVSTAIAGVIRLNEDVITLKVRPACGKPDFEDWKPVNKREKKVPSDVKIIDVDAKDIASNEVNYKAEEIIDPFIDGLSEEELTYINIGHFDPKTGPLNVIGEASSKVAGAAGETTTVLEEKGFPAMVMADGPAGLRLSEKYAKTDKKVYALTSPLDMGMTDLLPGFLKLVMKIMTPKPPKNAVYGEQYCTAIPIGTAIAQSFNCDLAYALGDIVGEEMEHFGINLWLAPALNIHRSIRCGRNFEYYSEDPLVSGLMAAAITNGVQKHKGRGTTIKHYAANNQETARYTNNSQVSQRAMREIYLKGFEICVKESQPCALMTSYNLLNGVHTSERRDLTQDILRREFGYKGIVMTDWVVSMMEDKNAKYRVALSSEVVKAGGDLFMPGCKKDFENIKEALWNKELDVKQLKINATRVYNMAKRLCE